MTTWLWANTDMQTYANMSLADTFFRNACRLQNPRLIGSSSRLTFGLLVDDVWYYSLTFRTFSCDYTHKKTWTGCHSFKQARCRIWIKLHYCGSPTFGLQGIQRGKVSTVTACVIDFSAEAQYFCSHKWKVHLISQETFIDPSIHPYSITTYPAFRVTGGWSLSKLSVGEGGVHPQYSQNWMACLH